MTRGRGRHKIGRGRVRHEIKREIGSHIGNGDNVHVEEQNIATASQFVPNPEPNEAPKIGANLPTLYPNRKMKFLNHLFNIFIFYLQFKLLTFLLLQFSPINVFEEMG